MLHTSYDCHDAKSLVCEPPVSAEPPYVPLTGRCLQSCQEWSGNTRDEEGTCKYCPSCYRLWSLEFCQNQNIINIGFIWGKRKPMVWIYRWWNYTPLTVAILKTKIRSTLWLYMFLCLLTNICVWDWCIWRSVEIIDILKTKFGFTFWLVLN